MCLRLVPRNKEVIERTAQPQSLKVVVGGDDRQCRLENATSQHQRYQSRRQKMSADHDVGAKGPDRLGGRSGVDAIPQRSPVRQLEWWIVRVVTPPDQPWSRFDKGKVTVVVERAVN